jgi:HD superfamily phosphohydrolase
MSRLKLRIRSPLLEEIIIESDTAVADIYNKGIFNLLEGIPQFPFGNRQSTMDETFCTDATHTRYEHSLIVYEIVGRLCDHFGIKDKNKELLQTAGLLHDIGNIQLPYHVLETKKGDHEPHTKKIIKTNRELVRKMKRHGLDPEAVAKATDSNIVDLADKLAYIAKDAAMTSILPAEMDSWAQENYSLDSLLQHLVMHKRGKIHLKQKSDDLMFPYKQVYNYYWTRMNLSNMYFFNDVFRFFGSALKEAAITCGYKPKYDKYNPKVIAQKMLRRLGRQKGGGDKRIDTLLNCIWKDYSWTHSTQMYIVRGQEPGLKELLQLASNDKRRMVFEKKVEDELGVYILIDSTQKINPWKAMPFLLENGKTFNSQKAVATYEKILRGEKTNSLDFPDSIADDGGPCIPDEGIQGFVVDIAAMNQLYYGLRDFRIFSPNPLSTNQKRKLTGMLKKEIHKETFLHHGNTPVAISYVI